MSLRTKATDTNTIEPSYWQDPPAIYRPAPQALKSVDVKLRVGGPATAHGGWVVPFITFCHQNAVPVDFVSTHSYLQDEHTFYPDRVGSPHAPSDYLFDQFKRVKREVAESARPDLEIHWTEWNSISAPTSQSVSWSNSPSVDNLYSGSFVLNHAVRADDLCDAVKSVDAELRVGGPATANFRQEADGSDYPKWVEEFMAFHDLCLLRKIVDAGPFPKGGDPLRRVGQFPAVARLMPYVVMEGAGTAWLDDVLFRIADSEPRKRPKH